MRQVDLNIGPDRTTGIYYIWTCPHLHQLKTADLTEFMGLVANVATEEGLPIKDDGFVICKDVGGSDLILAWELDITEYHGEDDAFET
jgi:hypothetical protein